MKNLNFKSALLWLMFAGAFLVMSAGQTQAQSSSFGEGGLYSTPAGQFVSVPEAEDRLIIEMKEIRLHMEGLIPGSQQYKAKEKKLAYFKSITNFLKTGSGVADSIVSGLGVFATDVYSNISRAEQLQLKEEAIDLLSV